MNPDAEMDRTLDVLGGPVVWSHLPAALAGSLPQALENSFAILAEHLRQSHNLDPIAVRFCNSSGITARLHTYPSNHHLITIPIGLFVRMLALGRRLWSYLDPEKKGINPKAAIAFATSPADDYDPDSFVVPPRVRCIFGDYSDDARFWSEIITFDSANDHDEKTEFNVSILVTQALSLIFAHEVGHAVLGHGPFIANVLRIQPEQDSLTAERRLARQGLELEADYFAGQVLAELCYADVARNNRLLSADDWNADFFRIGFTLVMLFGAFDPRRRSLNAYDREVYPHPIVRHEAARMGMLSFLSAIEGLEPLWRAGTITGWFRAQQCLNWFTLLECMEGASRDSLIPIHSLVYGGEGSSPYITQKLRHGQSLFDLARKLRRNYSDGAFAVEDLALFTPLVTPS